MFNTILVIENGIDIEERISDALTLIDGSPALEYDLMVICNIKGEVRRFGMLVEWKDQELAWTLLHNSGLMVTNNNNTL